MLELTPQALADLIEIGRIEARGTALHMLDVLDGFDLGRPPPGARTVAFHIDAAGMAVGHVRLTDPLAWVVLVVTGDVVSSIETVAR